MKNIIEELGDSLVLIVIGIATSTLFFSILEMVTGG